MGHPCSYNSPTPIERRESEPIYLGRPCSYNSALPMQRREGEQIHLGRPRSCSSATPMQRRGGESQMLFFIVYQEFSENKSMRISQ